MLSVAEEVKAKLKSDNCEKELYVTIGNRTITSEYIYRNSFNLTEQIISNNLEITGCISSMFKVKINTASGLTKRDYHGDNVSVSMKIHLTNGNLSAPIPIFNGYVDTVEKTDETWQEFTCYDALYFVGNTNIYNWYNNKYKSAGYPSFSKTSVTLREFRDNLFAYCAGNGISIRQVYMELPNDTMKIKKRFKNKDMTLIELLQGLCQINGCFGIINRNGLFEYRYISGDTPTEVIGAYPGLFYPGQVYPGQPLERSGGGLGGEYLAEYDDIKYSDDLVNPILNAITMRNNADDAGVSWGSSAGASTSWEDDTTDDELIDDATSITAGTYILEGNMFAYKIKRGNKKIAIANIYKRIGKDTYFRNYEAKSYGLPYLECGDKITYKKADGTEIEFIITKRVLSGDQYLVDTYSADSIDKKAEYVATGQSSVGASANNSITATEAEDIANNALANSGVLYIKSFSGGVLETTSTPPTQGG